VRRLFQIAAAVVFSSLSVPPEVLATSHSSLQQDAPRGASLTEGEVRKVDKDAKKLTIRHGPIQHLDMPGMTMVFQVSDPAMLEQVKAGDKIKFAADKVGGAYTVTRIEAQQ
jgi:Cu(I)/Ag(I) efflux system protein CusF